MSRLKRTTLAALTGITLVAGLVTAVSLTVAPAAQADTSPIGISGRGATVGFTEIEAEDAATNGTVIGPNRVYGQLPSEASGRKAVTLSAAGQYVEFTLTKPANAVDFRYSVPDSSDGSGITAPIDLQVNGTKLKALDFTSKYSWFYGGYPFSNTPSQGSPHHFYDDVRTTFGSTLAAGTKVRLQVSSTAIASSFTIDLADFYAVPNALSKPSGAIDVVTDYGADASGATDSTTKIQAAVNAGAAQGKTVWIPAGKFLVTSHIIVDGVSIAGAGPWYSVLAGKGVGIYGKYVADGGPSKNVSLKDFAVIGEVMERNDNDQVNAIGGAMSNSTVSDLWMQHVKVGAWMDGPMTGFTVTGSTVLDTTADGVNFHDGVSNSTVTNTFIRNTGDDGLAVWADTNQETADTFSHDTVVAPVLANNIAIYGGQDITVTDNAVADTVTNGGGIHVANRYTNVSAAAGTAVSGTFTIARNTLIRAGNSDYNWNFGVGALWFDGLNSPITGATINVTDTNILDSSYEAIQFIEGSVSGVHFSNVHITGTGTFALQLQTGGAATFDNVTATGIGYTNPIYNCGSGPTITQGAGNSGWYSASPYCGPWPTPVYGNGGSSTPTPTATAPTPTPSSTPTTGPTVPSTTNLAAGKTATATSYTEVYPAANAVDGNASTYWESQSNAFPQSLTVDLGATTSVGRIVVKLPPATVWTTRSQTIQVLGSTDGSAYTALKAAASYTFDPATGNTATISFPAASARWVRLTFTTNTGPPAAQASEYAIYAA